MSPQKQVVRDYISAFRIKDRPAILACLTDNVIWNIHGHASHHGKAAFEKEIDNDAFVGLPDISMGRMTEEDDRVILEGEVQCQLKDGPMLHLRFIDVFCFRDGLIRELDSYLVSSPT